MIFTVIASGSKGNVTYIASSKSQILIDIGISASSLEKNLFELEINPKKLDGIILTHTHIDHISGLKTFLKKYHTKLYLSSKMYDEVSKNIELSNYEIIEKDFAINDIDIKVIKLSHDSNDSNGYILNSNNKSLAYITDTGYINQKNHTYLLNKNAYIIESNHDIDLLMNGNRPYYLKQRILGDKGHLSNKDSSSYLSKFIGNNTKSVVLIHLSEDNNTPDLALSSIKEKLGEKNIKLSNIVISTQKKRTEMIEI